eukprot:2023560-Prymnesium_polylepis.1
MESGQVSSDVHSERTSVRSLASAPWMFAGKWRRDLHEASTSAVRDASAPLSIGPSSASSVVMSAVTVNLSNLTFGQCTSCSVSASDATFSSPQFMRG